MPKNTDQTVTSHSEPEQHIPGLKRLRRKEGKHDLNPVLLPVWGPLGGDNSPEVKIYLYDPDTLELGDEIPSSYTEPLITKRVYLERASEYLRRQLASLDSETRHNKQGRGGDAEGDKLVNTVPGMRAEPLVKEEPAAVVPGLKVTTRLLPNKEPNAIYISSHYVPSRTAFQAFLEFARNGSSYIFQYNPIEAKTDHPPGKAGDTAILHLEVYWLARVLQCEPLQQAAVDNLYCLLRHHLRPRQLKKKVLAKLISIVYGFMDAPDGVEASYPLSLSDDSNEYDAAQEVVLLYFTTHFTQLRSRETFGLFLMNGDFAKDVFWLAGDSSINFLEHTPHFSRC
ncbi:hypothetical protein BJ508DRAFT_364707 [Ascobolus immersus RN42]|uniref:Uncharacterized protein n=1 Tax=Ascobolus immersus RN42 TaxID=1160509 RepID=A0A3N4HT14_ASCIM|nr:hypothetical protein BJ508DRAFT_364707 [Ascobolus immersus RN42]